MNAFSPKRIAALSAAFCALLSVSLFSHASNRQEGGFDFSIYIPYAHSETIDFKGGASADIKDDIGFGLALAYNANEYLAARFDLNWTYRDYKGKRIINEDQTNEYNINSRLDTVRLSLGGDYYFLGDTNISPFLSASIGWETVDSNIPSAPPSTGCWWDPWWGYICQGYQPTHRDSNWFYNAGIGVRIPISTNNFARIGYYENRSSMSNVEGTPRFAETRLEFGWSY